jgi:hypothetical protein
MEVLRARCCGIDVHEASLVACLRVQDGWRRRVEVQSFGTTTAEILRLHAWLSATHCTRRNGIDRRLLAAGLQPARGQLRCRARQCASHQGRARS